MQVCELTTSLLNLRSASAMRVARSLLIIVLLANGILTCAGQWSWSRLVAAEAGPVRNLTDFLRAGEAAPGADDPRRDDSALLKRALAAGPGTVRLGPGTYRCGDVAVPSGVQLVGAGPATILYANSARPVISQKNVHDWAIRDLLLDGGEVGNWRLRDDRGRNGLLVDGCWGYEISGITLRNFDGAALRITRTNLPEAAFSNGGKLDRITAIGNYAGVHFDFRGEYVTATQLNCSQNIVGGIIHAGNTNISTSNFCGNGDGLWLSDKENGSHGTMSNCLFNHNERYALRARDVENGMSVNGCCFYYGAIELLGCRGINVTNGQIGCHVTVIGKSANRFSGNCIVAAEYHFRFDSATLVQDNFTYEGPWKPTLGDKPARLRLLGK